MFSPFREKAIYDPMVPASDTASFRTNAGVFGPEFSVTI